MQLHKIKNGPSGHAEAAKLGRFLLPVYADNLLRGREKARLGVDNGPPVHWRRPAMASSAHIFFAGVGTTFVILAAGFGGGLLLAKSAVHDPSPKALASSEQITPVRVILPASAEPAQPQQQAPPAVSVSEAQPEVQQTQKFQRVDEAQAENRKVQAEKRASLQRYAERKAKRIAAARAKRQIEQPPRPEPAIMAFGDGPRIGGFFGN
jgi:hypothetical protein